MPELGKGFSEIFFTFSIYYSLPTLQPIFLVIHRNDHFIINGFRGILKRKIK